MLKLITPSMLLLGLLVGCAKEQAYDEVNSKTSGLVAKSAQQNKSRMLDMCTLDDPCIYVPSVANTPYAVTASRPFWQGEQKLVVTNITHEKLQFLEIEDDERFQGNINNFSPVLNVKVDHIDYKCAEDDYGDCTNKEEEDEDKPWNERRKINITEFEVVEANSLPIQMSNLFDSGCFTETDETITKLDVEDDAMNVVVKKTYKAAAKCSSITSYDDLRYLNFTVDYTYSIMKLSSLTDKSYEKIEYPTTDQAKFGFFKTTEETRTVDNHDHYMGVKKDYVNRWSPNRGDIIYKLNSEFYTPENKLVLEATHKAIKTVNDSLALANAGIQIKLEKGDDSKIGDLRENFIILVKDPQASGVIGYGPSIANPKTGEIINARTVMYYGTIQKFVSYAYDDLVDEVIAEAQRAASETPASETPAETPAESNISNLAVKSTKFANFLASQRNENKLEAFSDFLNTPIVDNHVSSVSKEEALEDFKNNMERVFNGGMTEEEELKARLSKDTFYHSDFVNYDDAVVAALKNDLKNGQLKYWESLTESQRKAIMEKLLPYVWIPTLVHEFGHNLGLRHNFYGNIDKDNYYTTEERQAIGMSRDAEFSSIMDYAPRQNNELFVMGKYDIAALRFAYAREVELDANAIVKLPRVSLTDDSGKVVGSRSMTLKEFMSGESAPKLKNFKFCTDEDVSSDPLCNRHDEGNSYESVVKYYIDKYNKDYDKVNNRKRRYNFESRYGDMGYFYRLVNQFFTIRNFFEIFDQRVSSGNYDSGSNWEQNERLVDIKKAADLSFDFFMDIIEAPSYHCIEIDPESGSVTRVAPFNEMAKGSKLEEFGITFDIKYGCLLLNSYTDSGKQYAEFGKYFNNSLDLLYDASEREQNDTSQIDVRGVWMDKAFASMFIAARFNSPTTIGAASAGNYFDYAMYKERLDKTMKGLLNNSLESTVEVTLPNGSKASFPTDYRVDSGQVVNKSYNYVINYVFGLNESRTNLKDITTSLLKGYLGQGSNNDVTRLNSYRKYSVSRVNVNVNLEDYNFDKVIEFKSGDTVEYKFGIYAYNEIAMELAEKKEKLDLLPSYDQEVLGIAYNMSINPELTGDTLRAMGTIDEAKIVAAEEALGLLGKEFLPAYVQGIITEKSIKSSLISLSLSSNTIF